MSILPGVAVAVGSVDESCCYTSEPYGGNVCLSV